MNIIKNVFAVILGYAVFVISALLLFNLSHIDPHADPSTGFLIMTLVCGMISAFVGGVLTQLISSSGSLKINYILATVIAAFATFSLLKTGGNHYSQIAAIFLFAPISLLAAVIYLRRKGKY